MRQNGRLKRIIASGALAITAVTGLLIGGASPALAAPTTCKVITVSGQTFSAINPRMTVPICYNGGSVWQSGNITPGVTTAGYDVSGFDWYGSYGGGTSFGVGENFMARIYTGGFTFYCTPRWTINVWGNVTSYNRGC